MYRRLLGYKQLQRDVIGQRTSESQTLTGMVDWVGYTNIPCSVLVPIFQFSCVVSFRSHKGEYVVKRYSQSFV